MTSRFLNHSFAYIRRLRELHLGGSQRYASLDCTRLGGPQKHGPLGFIPTQLQNRYPPEFIPGGFLVGGIMYLLYLDDSGSVDDANQDYFVLGGLCLPEDSIFWLTNKLDNYAESLDPGNGDRVEFHASEIFGGRSAPWNNLKRPKERTDIIKTVLKILQGSHNTTAAFACAVHKESFPGQDPFLIAFEDLCSRFDLYLNRIFHDKNQANQKGMIILDESSYEQRLQRLALSFRQHGTRWRELKDIVEVPFFVDSKASRIIQMADHIAYSVFRYYNAKDMTYFDCIFDKFDKNQGVIHGLVHKQHNNPNCPCPSCMTRRLTSEHNQTS